MRLWSVLFGLMGLFFIVSPQIFTEFLNRFSHLLSGGNDIPLPYPAERFWYSLAVSLMVTITYLSFVASRDIRRNFHCVIAVLICKFTSTLFFLLAFASGLRSAGYLVSGLLSDGPIFLITLIFAIRATVARRKIAGTR
jgi:hypothetical protein